MRVDRVTTAAVKPLEPTAEEYGRGQRVEDEVDEVDDGGEANEATGHPHNITTPHSFYCPPHPPPSFTGEA